MTEELLGPIADGWRYLTLGEVCRLGGGDIQTGPFGSQLHASDYVADGIPSIMPVNIGENRISDEKIARVSEDDAERLKRYRVQVGDIIYSRRGDVERRSLIREREDGWLCGTGCLRVRIGRAIADPEFTAQYLGHPAVREWIVRHAHGATMPNLNTSILAACPFVLPPMREQEAIASALGALDDKIELNRLMNGTLEVMARTIFKDWFVDFGPTRAKMEGRAPYFAPDIWSLFPDHLDDEGKPEGWDFGTLGDLAEQVGESVQPGALDPETPYIGLEHMPRKSIALSEWEGAGKVTSGKLAFRKGDFLFGKLRPFFHKVGIAPLDGICSTDIVVLNARERKAAAFVLACISQDEFVAFTDRTSDGTKMPRTSWGRMERYRLCLPSGSALEAFNACVEPLLDRIISNIHESRALAATRDLLLPKLMSGEVRVRDAAKHIGNAT